MSGLWSFLKNSEYSAVDFMIVIFVSWPILGQATTYSCWQLYAKKELEVAQLVKESARGMQVLKVLGLNPEAVYRVMTTGLCATGVLRPA